MSPTRKVTLPFIPRGRPPTHKGSDVQGEDAQVGESKSNRHEIKDIVKLTKSFPPHVLQNLTVLTLYKKQVTSLITRFKEENETLEVHTLAEKIDLQEKEEKVKSKGDNNKSNCKGLHIASADKR